MPTKVWKMAILVLQEPCMRESDFRIVLVQLSHNCNHTFLSSGYIVFGPSVHPLCNGPNMAHFWEEINANRRMIHVETFDLQAEFLWLILFARTQTRYYRRWDRWEFHRMTHMVSSCSRITYKSASTQYHARWMSSDAKAPIRCLGLDFKLLSTRFHSMRTTSRVVLPKFVSAALACWVVFR
jgi:hypothetical protein